MRDLRPRLAQIDCVIEKTRPEGSRLYWYRIVYDPTLAAARAKLEARSPDAALLKIALDALNEIARCDWRGHVPQEQSIATRALTAIKEASNA